MSNIALLTLLFAALSAQAAETLYASPHPVPAGRGSYCHLAASHAHEYAPHFAGDYRAHEGHLVFIGDPSQAAAYRGPLFRYEGSHPVPHDASLVNTDKPFVARCSTPGLHRHAWEPPPSAPFGFSGGVFRYRGDAAEGSRISARTEKESAPIAESSRVSARSEKEPARVVDVTARIEKESPPGVEFSARSALSSFVSESNPTARVTFKKAKKHRKRHHDHDDEDDDDDDDDHKRKHDDDD